MSEHDSPPPELSAEAPSHDLPSHDLKSDEVPVLADLVADSDGWMPVERRSVSAERIAGWILTVILLGIGAAIMIPIMLAVGFFGWGGGITLTVYVVIAGLLIWLAHGLPAIQYRYIFYRIGPLGFEIRRGIWWRKRITVPLARIQHVDVAQGPLLRRFALGTLTVYTAGTEYASVQLTGLAFETAQQLRDQLVAGRELNDGV